jgi:flagellar biosynthetic protein FlhB
LSDDQDKDSKTEDPTGKKMQDALDKGNVAISPEVAIFTSTLAFYMFLVFFLPKNSAHLAEVLKGLVEHPEQWNVEQSSDLVSLCGYLLLQSAHFLLPAAILFMSFGMLASVGQHMPSFVLERIRPQWNRISPASGFKRLFSVNGLVNFGKSLVKIVAAGVIMYLSLRSEYFKLLDSIFSDPQTVFPILMGIVRKMVIVVLACAFIVAAADVLWTRFQWHSNLKMTKQEVKDEMKQSQGDPVVKSRQRSIARDRARRRMISNVPRATLVITNPTHYAVALRYVAQESEAPIVVAKGQDLVALRIREIAQENGIPIFEDPPLARSMFAQVSVDSVIPSVFYKAVAELIHRVYAARRPNKRMR